jgi:membrane-bound serine protease (ClpP class)
VLEDFSGSGRVRAFGEIWQAHTEVPMHAGDRARVEAVDGLILRIVPETNRET